MLLTRYKERLFQTDGDDESDDQTAATAAAAAVAKIYADSPVR